MHIITARLLAGLAALFFFLTSFALAASCPEGEKDYPPFHSDPARFDAAIAGEETYRPSPARLSGVTVPHHLVAAHLIARGLRAASGFAYERVIVLTPDHFSRTQSPFATTLRSFETVKGHIAVDRDAVEALLAAGMEESCLFAREHGLRAVLPFLRHYFPDAKLVPVAISPRSRRADWDRLAELLGPLATEGTLVVQSTDFSHYHPHEAARQLDQQVLNLVAEGSLDRIAMLRQPDHLDSLAGMYVQKRLQREVFGAAPVAVASENQQQYTPRRLGETTGYIVFLFGRFDEDFLRAAGGAVFYFAGDAHFGRAVTPALSDPDAAGRVTDAVLALTGGRPLVVNLEGVILPNVPEALDPMTLAMPEGLTLPLLERLGVAAAGLANNHAMDLGAAGFSETTAALDAAGIAWFGQGDRLDLGPLTVVGLTDLDGNGPPYSALIGDDMLGRLTIADAARPVVAFVHWGREYAAEPSARETALGEAMRLSGASAIVGAHPHVASAGLAALGGGEAVMAYSLGNFLFDQSEATASGALLELRVFSQGTIFARLLPLPNLFDLAKPARR